MQALNDYVIVEPKTRSDDLSSDVLTVKTQYEGEPNKGVVKAVGPYVDNVKVGQLIVFDEKMPRGFKVGEEDYLFVREEFVIVVLED